MSIVNNFLQQLDNYIAEHEALVSAEDNRSCVESVEIRGGCMNWAEACHQSRLAVKTLRNAMSSYRGYICGQSTIQPLDHTLSMVRRQVIDPFTGLKTLREAISYRGTAKRTEGETRASIVAGRTQALDDYDRLKSRLDKTLTPEEAKSFNWELIKVHNYFFLADTTAISDLYLEILSFDTVALKSSIAALEEHEKAILALRKMPEQTFIDKQRVASLKMVDDECDRIQKVLEKHRVLIETMDKQIASQATLYLSDQRPLIWSQVKFAEESLATTISSSTDDHRQKAREFPTDPSTWVYNGSKKTVFEHLRENLDLITKRLGGLELHFTKWQANCAAIVNRWHLAIDKYNALQFHLEGQLTADELQTMSEKFEFGSTKGWTQLKQHRSAKFEEILEKATKGLWTEATVGPVTAQIDNQTRAMRKAKDQIIDQRVSKGDAEAAALSEQLHAAAQKHRALIKEVDDFLPIGETLDVAGETPFNLWNTWRNHNLCKLGAIPSQYKLSISDASYALGVIQGLTMDLTGAFAKYKLARADITKQALETMSDYARVKTVADIDFTADEKVEYASPASWTYMTSMVRQLYCLVLKSADDHVKPHAERLADIRMLSMRTSALKNAHAKFLAARKSKVPADVKVAAEKAELEARFKTAAITFRELLKKESNGDLSIFEAEKLQTKTLWSSNASISMKRIIEIEAEIKDDTVTMDTLELFVNAQSNRTHNMQGCLDRILEERVKPKTDGDQKLQERLNAAKQSFNAVITKEIDGTLTADEVKELRSQMLWTVRKQVYMDRFKVFETYLTSKKLNMGDMGVFEEAQALRTEAMQKLIDQIIAKRGSCPVLIVKPIEVTADKVCVRIIQNGRLFFSVKLAEDKQLYDVTFIGGKDGYQRINHLNRTLEQLKAILELSVSVDIITAMEFRVIIRIKDDNTSHEFTNFFVEKPNRINSEDYGYVLCMALAHLI